MLLKTTQPGPCFQLEMQKPEGVFPGENQQVAARPGEPASLPCSSCGPHSFAGPIAKLRGGPGFLLCAHLRPKFQFGLEPVFLGQSVLSATPLI